jgi:hypothetical protein
MKDYTGNKITEYHLQSDHIQVKASTIVRLTEHFSLITMEGPVDLSVDITADLGNIPDQYQEVMLNMLTSKYLNKVSFGHNPFSECQPTKKRRWYQVWKSKYFV